MGKVSSCRSDGAEERESQESTLLFVYVTRDVGWVSEDAKNMSVLISHSILNTTCFCVAQREEWESQKCGYPFAGKELGRNRADNFLNLLINHPGEYLRGLDCTGTFMILPLCLHSVESVCLESC